MNYTDLIFDLYGTLVDIHTEEHELVWAKTAFFFGFYGAHYSGPELKTAFQVSIHKKEVEAGQDYECYPDIPFELVMTELFEAKGTFENAAHLGIEAAQLFRILSLEYIRLYPGVTEALAGLRKKGYRLWLLSNAQQVFTDYELNLLDLKPYFDGIYLSSDFRCRKPDPRFFQVLLEEQDLDPKTCLMIGNDRTTDIAGAKALGISTLFLQTNLTPDHQLPAAPALFPGKITTDSREYEYAGSDWKKIMHFLA